MPDTSSHSPAELLGPAPISPKVSMAPIAGKGGATHAQLPSQPSRVPHYLQQVYWWAYVHPRAVRFFERGWLVNAILFGNYARLRQAAIAAMGEPGESGEPGEQESRIPGRSLQVACVYGDLTLRLQKALAPGAQLDVLDILPVQLDNLANKLPQLEGVHLLPGDSSAMPMADASYEQVLMFFLLHEQPEAVRRATMAQALRVLKPGGKLVIVDYHRPAAWHPLRPLMRLIFKSLEPFAMDLWRHELTSFLPAQDPPIKVEQHLYFGGLYQKLVLRR